MLEFIQIILRWWKQIAIFCGIAVLTSIIVSMPAIMPPYYSSQILFYPSNPAASDRAVLFRADGALIDYFGGKDDINRFLSVANSSALITFLVDSFQLKKHYDIEDEGMFYVMREFKGNYKAMKNELGAIEVSILDTDPVLASKMVKAAVNYIDNENKQLLRENKLKTLEVFKKNFDQQNTQLRLLADSLSSLKKIYPVSYDTDGNIIGDEKVRLLGAQVKSLSESVNQSKELINQYEVSLADDFTTIHVIEDAAIPEKKVKPVRWMIVSGTLLGAFAFAVLTILTLEMFRRAKSSVD